MLMMDLFDEEIDSGLDVSSGMRADSLYFAHRWH